MKIAVTACLCLATALPAAAEMYRCSAPGTAVSYQQQPCDASAIEDKVGIPSQYPDYTAARDRLAAREAAADARILERMRIESNERIARAEQASREAQVAAEMERAQAADASYPVYVVGYPPRVRGQVKPRPRVRVQPH